MKPARWLARLEKLVDGARESLGSQERLSGRVPSVRELVHSMALSCGNCLCQAAHVVPVELEVHDFGRVSWQHYPEMNDGHETAYVLLGCFQKTTALCSEQTRVPCRRL